MNAEIVTIGTELLLGEIIDTNAAKLARMLREIGVNLYYKTTVGDNEERITEVIDAALNRADVVITSGGLGPTADDITRQAVANATGHKLVYSEELEGQIRARFRGFGRNMTENNKRQAFIPEDATPIHNPVGTAPCFLSEDSTGRGFVICLPGVPRELEHLMSTAVLPMLKERLGGTRMVQVRILRTCAVGESNVDLAINDLMDGSNPTIGLSAHAGQTDIRITAVAETPEAADVLIAPVEAVIRKRLGVAVYGVEEESVAEVLGRLLEERNLKLGVVDTVTQGHLVQDFIQAGFGHVVTAIDTERRPAQASPGEEETLVSGLAERASLEGGVGLALVGSLTTGRSSIAIYGPGEVRITRPAQTVRRESEYMRRWLVVQGLDWVRRAVLGQLTSPVDWKSS